MRERHDRERRRPRPGDAEESRRRCSPGDSDVSAYCGLPTRLELSSAPARSTSWTAGQGFRIGLARPRLSRPRADATDAARSARDNRHDRTFRRPRRHHRRDHPAERVGLALGVARRCSRRSWTPQPGRCSPTRPRTTSSRVSLVLRADTAPHHSTQTSPPGRRSGWRQAGWRTVSSSTRRYAGRRSSSLAGRPYDLTFDRAVPGVAPGEHRSSSFPMATTRRRRCSRSTGRRRAPPSPSPTPTGARRRSLCRTISPIPAGHYVVIDCGARTIVDDTGANVYGDALDSFATWPTAHPGEVNVISFFATGTAGATLPRRSHGTTDG